MLGCAACAENPSRATASGAPLAFYTVTGEIALSRHAQRTAALQYAIAAEHSNDPDLLRRALEVTFETSQPTLALQIARRWYRIDPRSVDSHRAAARAALALQQVDESAAQYRVLLTRSGTETTEFALLRTDLTSSENVFGARQVADRIATWFPASPEALRIAGLTQLRADDPVAAARSLEDALQGLPDATPEERQALAAARARARILAGNPDEPLRDGAERAHTDATASDRFQYALLLLTAQRDSQAIEQLRILSGDKQWRPEALRLMGLLEFQQGHLDAAATLFRRLLDTGRLLDDGYYYLALIADRNDDADGALRLYSQVQHGDNVFPAMVHAAAALYRHGAAPAAEQLLDRLLAEEPQREPEVIVARMRLYQDAGDWDRALGTLERGIADYPDDVELRYARVSVFEDQQRVDAALRELESVLKRRPDDPAAMNALGFTLAEHAMSLARAQRLIERAHRAAPRNYAILDSLGWIEFRRGHADLALPYLRMAYGGDRSADIAAHLGEVLWRLGKVDEANRLFTEASVMDADNKVLRATRRRLHAEN